MTSNKPFEHNMDIWEKRDYVMDNIDNIRRIEYNRDAVINNSVSIVIIQFSPQSKYTFMICMLSKLDIDIIMARSNICKYNIESVYNTVHGTRVN
jgi:hypothetical protein